MPSFPKSPPITLQQIESISGASSLKSAGDSYIGTDRTISMLDFIGVSDLGVTILQKDVNGNPASNPGEGHYISTVGWRPALWFSGDVPSFTGYLQAYATGGSGSYSYLWSISYSDAVLPYSVSPDSGSTTVPYLYDNGLAYWSGNFTVLVTVTDSVGYSRQATFPISYSEFEIPPPTFSTNYGFGGSPSDIRLKRDIVLLETRDDGIKVYSFRYKTSEEYYIGVIAQDLIGTKWESAVGTDANGFYFVDYSQLPIDFKVIPK